MRHNTTGIGVRLAVAQGLSIGLRVGRLEQVGLGLHARRITRQSMNASPASTDKRVARLTSMTTWGRVSGGGPRRP